MLPTAPFGRTGHASSRVIFGAAALGAMRQDRAGAVLDQLLAAGVNHLDTAAGDGAVPTDAELQADLAETASHRSSTALPSSGSSCAASPGARRSATS